MWAYGVCNVIREFIWTAATLLCVQLWTGFFDTYCIYVHTYVCMQLDTYVHACIRVHLHLHSVIIIISPRNSALSLFTSLQNKTHPHFSIGQDVFAQFAIRHVFSEQTKNISNTLMHDDVCACTYVHVYMYRRAIYIRTCTRGSTPSSQI